MVRNQGKAKSGRRDETKSKREQLSSSKITFSFASFLGKDEKDIGQSWNEWLDTDPTRISRMLEVLCHLSKLNSAEAKENKCLSVYGKFPPDSKFTCPGHLNNINTWGVIRKLGGKVRAAGFYDKNAVFHIVFLDQDHDFWPTEN